LIPGKSRGLLVALTVAGAWCTANATTPTLPTPQGPYGVGRVSYHLTDDSRPEVLGADPGRPREVMLHVWYPTSAATGRHVRTAPYLPGLDKAASRLSTADLKDLFRPAIYDGELPVTHAVEHAPFAPGHNRFPLLLFSHGWGNPTFLYTAELEDIVSRGYVVAAIDHPYDTAFTEFPDGRLVFFAHEQFDAALKAPDGYVRYARTRVTVMAEDNRFALDRLLELATVPSLKAPFLARVDTTRIGAFGHSIGGLAAARTCQIDSRLRACIDQDSDDDRGSPFIVTDLQETQHQPFLLFVASSADETSPRRTHPDDADLQTMKMTRSEYDAALRTTQANQLAQLAGIPGGAYRVTLYALPGITHRSFTDQTLLPPVTDPEQSLHNFRVIQAFTLAFFDKFLKDDPHTLLDTGAAPDSRVRVERFAR